MSEREPGARSTSFSALIDAFLREEFEASPVNASSLGLTAFDDQLDDLSEAAFSRREQAQRDWLRRFEDVQDDGLTFEERIDRDLVISQLRGRVIMADWQMWRRQPDTYLNPALEGVHGLLLHRLRPEPELIGSAAARLRQVPRVLADGKRNLQPELAPALYVQRAIGQAEAGVEYLRSALPAEIADPELRRPLAEAGAVAALALEDFAQYLHELEPRAQGEWAIGEERYTRLLRERELLDVDARGLRERGRAEYEQLAEALRGYARQIGGTDDWVQVLHNLNEDHPRTPEAMRQGYADWTRRAREFLLERGLVSFPEGEQCLVEPSPLFERPVLAVASYQNPPPFSTSHNGHFFVPYPPDGVSEDEVQQRLANNSYPGIPTTAVHEAYPGHHWHLVTAQGNPRRVRQVFGTPYFWEGWGLYAERLMREQGFFPDAASEMFQYEATLFRAARIVVDTSLHMGEMPFDEAVRFMMDKANLTHPTAAAEVGRYCSWPTQASAYLTGCLEIVRIRERYLQEKRLSGIAGLRQFHDTLARSGSLPIALAERAVLAG